MTRFELITSDKVGREPLLIKYLFQTFNGISSLNHDFILDKDLNL